MQGGEREGSLLLRWSWNVALLLDAGDAALGLDDFHFETGQTFECAALIHHLFFDHGEVAVV